MLGRCPVPHSASQKLLLYEGENRVVQGLCPDTPLLYVVVLFAARLPVPVL